MYIHTKQNKSNLTITQNTQFQSQNQGKKKYQPPQNYKQRFKPINPIKKIKIKTTILVITHTTKSTNRIKEQKRKKDCIFHTQTTIDA
jgi:hypothetical protein